eukprot:gene9086-9256_t
MSRAVRRTEPVGGGLFKTTFRLYDVHMYKFSTSLEGSLAAVVLEQLYGHQAPHIKAVMEKLMHDYNAAELDYLTAEQHSQDANASDDFFSLHTYCEPAVEQKALLQGKFGSSHIGETVAMNSRNVYQDAVPPLDEEEQPAADEESKCTYLPIFRRSITGVDVYGVYAQVEQGQSKFGWVGLDQLVPSPEEHPTCAHGLQAVIEAHPPEGDVGAGHFFDNLFKKQANPNSLVAHVGRAAAAMHTCIQDCLEKHPLDELDISSITELVQVDWYPWCEEAFEAARTQNKPIFLSVGYATCHWCHVMERESFESEDTAAIMNQHFINVKVDREERPDVDRVYVSAQNPVE